MDALVSAAQACAAEMTRRLSHMPADQIQAQVRAGTISAHQARLHLGAAVVPHEAPRPMVDGDICASPDDQASGAQLSRWRQFAAGIAAAIARGESVHFRCACGCADVFRRDRKMLALSRCAAHSEGFSESWNGRAR